MKDTIRAIMHEKLYAFQEVWRSFLASGGDLSVTRSIVDAFAGFTDDMLIVDIDGKYYTYRHYGRTFIEKFSVDLSNKTLEDVPPAVLPKERRQILEFEYSHAQLAIKPIWRAYTAEIDGVATTWQRLTLPIAPNALVVGVYEMPSIALPPTTALARLIETVIASVPVTLNDAGEIESLVVSLSDLTQSQLNEAELKYLASTDPLTGASNRRRLLAVGNEEMQRSIRYAHPLSVLMLDLDHFKHINDTHGHASGDEVLRRVSATCTDLLRQNDVLGRCGGEEFAVILPDTDVEGAALLAERLRVKIAGIRVPTEAAPLQVTVSIGIGAFSPEDTTIDDLLKRADQALYRAKARGRDCVAVAGDDSEVPS